MNDLCRDKLTPRSVAVITLVYKSYNMGIVSWKRCMFDKKTCELSASLKMSLNSQTSERPTLNVVPRGSWSVFGFREKSVPDMLLIHSD